MTGNSSKKRRNAPSAVQLEFPSFNDRMPESIKFVTHNTKLVKIAKIGGLRFPRGSKEGKRYVQIKRMLEEYAAREKVEHPLSIVVFGPPGSGKSFGVKEILKSVHGKFIVSLSANLSQLTSTEELAEAFHEKIDELNKAKVEALDKDNLNIQSQDKGSSKINGLLKITPVFIFDEFDTALNGDSLGWLRWFLAPMQDGKFLHNSESVSIRKAVFIFAGGTAASFDEFEKRAQMDQADYRDKKVPDFISRLRGFIDIQGLNQLDNERAVRRALVLNRLLDDRWPKKRVEGVFPIEKDLAERLLSNVHFVHGIRSMEAILEMSGFGNKQTLGRGQLPDDDLKRLHLSRGLLDKKVIGVSAGQHEKEANNFLHTLTGSLLLHGATLAYGGDFIADGTLNWIVEAAKRVPDDLVKRNDKRIRNYLGFPTFYNRKIMAEHKRAKTQVELVRLETLTKPECDDLGVPTDGWFPARPLNSATKYNPKHHLAWALSLFRMRARMIHDINALIVIGGKDKKDDESWGRFSGIAEEVTLAVALGKPVYVLGGRGGAARAVGRLLGLDQSLANPDTCLADLGGLEPGVIHKNFTNCFTIPGHPNLPQTVPAVRSYLFEHSVLTDFWPKNGLTLAENRELFTTEITQSKWGRCADLIIQGLTRLDWKDAGPRS